MNRLFLAVPIRLHYYDGIQAEFGPYLQGRWREESTLHITVAFLGDTFSERLLLEKLEGLDWSFHPSLIDGFDYFRGSRVFVATAVNDSLQRLRERLEERLELDTQILRPHVTLMRVKKIADFDHFSALMMQKRIEPIGTMKPSIALYRSRLTPEGAHYSIVKVWAL